MQTVKVDNVFGGSSELMLDPERLTSGARGDSGEVKITADYSALVSGFRMFE